MENLKRIDKFSELVLETLQDDTLDFLSVNFCFVRRNLYVSYRI